MTLVIPMTSLWSFTMEDQCLDEDETLLSDEWETQSEELNFLCNNPGEEGKSILRQLIEFPFSFQSYNNTLLCMKSAAKGPVHIFIPNSYAAINPD